MPRKDVDAMLDLGLAGVSSLVAIQKEVLGAAKVDLPALFLPGRWIAVSMPPAPGSAHARERTTLVIASSNRAKIIEFKELLRGLPFQVVGRVRRPRRAARRERDGRAHSKATP